MKIYFSRLTLQFFVTTTLLTSSGWGMVGNSDELKESLDLPSSSTNHPSPEMGKDGKKKLKVMALPESLSKEDKEKLKGTITELIQRARQEENPGMRVKYFYNISLVYSASGNNDLANVFLDKALDSLDPDKDNNSRREIFLYQRGLNFYKSGEIEKALAFLLAGLFRQKLPPEPAASTHKLIHDCQGASAAAMGDALFAFHHKRKADELKKASDDAEESLLGPQLSQKAFQETIDEIDELRNQNNFPKALHVCFEACMHTLTDKQLFQIYSRMGFCYSSQGEYSRAIDAFHRAGSFYYPPDEDRTLLEALGQALIKAKQNRDAVFVYHDILRSLSSADERAAAATLIASYFAAENMIVEAESFFTKAMQTNTSKYTSFAEQVLYPAGRKAYDVGNDEIAQVLLNEAKSRGLSEESKKGALDILLLISMGKGEIRLFSQAGEFHPQGSKPEGPSQTTQKLKEKGKELEKRKESKKEVQAKEKEKEVKKKSKKKVRKRKEKELVKGPQKMSADGTVTMSVLTSITPSLEKLDSDPSSGGPSSSPKEAASTPFQDMPSSFAGSKKELPERPSVPQDIPLSSSHKSAASSLSFDSKNSSPGDSGRNSYDDAASENSTEGKRGRSSFWQKKDREGTSKERKQKRGEQRTLMRQQSVASFHRGERNPELKDMRELKRQSSLYRVITQLSQTWEQQGEEETSPTANPEIVSVNDEIGRRIEDLNNSESTDPLAKSFQGIYKSLQEDARKGEGQPKRLKGVNTKKWSGLKNLYRRKLTKKDRIIYTITVPKDRGRAVVKILQIGGHYGD